MDFQGAYVAGRNRWAPQQWQYAPHPARLQSCAPLQAGKSLLLEPRQHLQQPGWTPLMAHCCLLQGQAGKLCDIQWRAGL